MNCITIGEINDMKKVFIAMIISLLISGCGKLSTCVEDNNSHLIKLSEYGIEPCDYEDVIDQDIVLSDEETIESIEWVDPEKTILRIRVGYKEMPENPKVPYLWFLHTKDYIFYKNDEKVYSILIDYSIDSGSREVYDSPSFDSRYEDVNFDGKNDIVISLGRNGYSGMQMYCAYIWNNGQYEYCENFEKKIISYEFDIENEIIISHTVEGNTGYKYENGDYVEAWKVYHFRNHLDE